MLRCAVMKIAMIGQKGYPSCSGGIEKHVEELSKRLARQGHEVLVFCRAWYTKDQGELDGVKRVFVPTVNKKNLDAIVHTFLSIIKAAQMDVDVFHIHGVGPSLLSWLPRLLRPGSRVVVTFHCVDRFHQKWGRFARLMLHLGEWTACRFPNKTITVSQTLTNYAAETYRANSAYIPNGVTMPEPSRDPSLVEVFGLVPDKYFIMVSRLVRHKGAHTLIRAWQSARAARPDLFSEMKLAIVGGAAFTDDYVHELHSLAAGDGSIVLAGAQSGDVLHELFANAYAAVHPSVSEGLPIAVLEEMSYGKCVLSSDIPECLELTAAHGLSFPAGNAEALARSMVMMAEAPPQTKQVGAEAAQFVKRFYNWDDIALMTSVIYEETFPHPIVEIPVVE